MDSFEINKIVACVLVVALVFIGLANFSEILYHVDKPKVAAYQVEGGDEITKNLIKNRLIDKFYLFKSSKNLKTVRKHKFFTSFSILNSRYKKKSKISSKLAKDNITIYKR